MTITAIPTTYQGIEFRSRLEAKWAFVFDQFEWTWEYEAIDLAGYIPDFIILFPHGPMLVEVKPAMTQEDLEAAIPKIEASGWDGEALILGAVANFDNFYTNTFGLITARKDYEDDHWAWDWAVHHFCDACQRQSLHHTNGVWVCRVCGAYDGDRFINTYGSGLIKAWNAATNAAKYRHGKR
jgi:hypothetical protein